MSQNLKKFLILLISSFGTGIGTSICIHTFSLFVDPLKKEFGWSVLDINLALPIGYVVASIFSIPLGMFMDKYGSRKIVLISFIVMAIGIILRAMSTSILMFYLSQAVLCCMFYGITSFQVGKLIGLWFPEKNQNFMIGIVSSSNDLFSFIASPVFAHFIEKGEWRMCCYLVAGLCLFLTFLTFFGFEKSPVSNESPDVKKIYRTMTNLSLSPISKRKSSLRSSPSIYPKIAGNSIEKKILDTSNNTTSSKEKEESIKIPAYYSVVSRNKDLESNDNEEGVESTKTNNELGVESTKTNNELVVESTKTNNELVVESTKTNNELVVESTKTNNEEEKPVLQRSRLDKLKLNSYLNIPLEKEKEEEVIVDINKEDKNQNTDNKNQNTIAKEDMEKLKTRRLSFSPNSLILDKNDIISKKNSDINLSSTKTIKENNTSSPSTSLHPNKLRKKKDPKIAGLTLKQAIKMKNFWLISIAVILSQYTYGGVMALNVSITESLIGFDFQTASQFLSVISGSAFVSKVTFSYISEKLSAKRGMIISLSLQCIGLALLAFHKEINEKIFNFGDIICWVGGSIYGFGMGSVGVLMASCLIEFFGPNNYGAIAGVTQLGAVFPLSLGPIISTEVYNISDSYQLALLIAIGLFFIGVILTAFAVPSEEDKREMSQWGNNKHNFTLKNLTTIEVVK